MYNKALAIINEVRKAVVGKDNIVAKILMAILAQGHILLEDCPGVGKTTMVLAFSKALDLSYKRMQFTPEILPGDVVGYTVINKNTGMQEYRPGAALCNLFLADEINRTSSKTQSALLEAMEEGSLTVDGVTHVIPRPYTVIATQNPIGSTGTQLLPESQMDRFIIKLSIGYPQIADEVRILKQKQGNNPLDSVTKVADKSDIIEMQKTVENIFISDEVYEYIARLAAATRNHPMIKMGASPRASIALTRMSRSAAWVSKRDYVVPEDIQNVFFDVFEHRILVNARAGINGATAHAALEDVLRNVHPPRLS